MHRCLLFTGSRPVHECLLQRTSCPTRQMPAGPVGQCVTSPEHFFLLATSKLGLTQYLADCGSFPFPRESSLADAACYNSGP